MRKRKPFWRDMTVSLIAVIAFAMLLYFVLFRFDNLSAIWNALIRILSPFVVGGVIAYILKPGCNAIEKRLNARSAKKGKPSAKFNAGISVVVMLLVAVIVVAVLLLMVIPALVRSIYSIALMIPGKLQDVADWIEQYAADNEELGGYITDFTNNLSTSIPEWLTTKVLPNLQGMIGSVSSGVTGFVNVVYNLFMGVIVSIYLLCSRKKLAVQGKMVIRAAFPKKWADAILDEFHFADGVFTGFISGRIWDSLIVGIICFIGMLILRMPYPMLISVIVGVTNVIPFFGPYIGMIPSFLLVLLVSPVKSLIFLVFLFILQQFDGNIMGPRILGNVTGLSSFWVLFSILTFGGLFGFIGMLIGVPTFAVLYDIFKKLVYKGLAYRKVQDVVEEEAPVPREKSVGDEEAD